MMDRHESQGRCTTRCPDRRATGGWPRWSPRSTTLSRRQRGSKRPYLKEERLSAASRSCEDGRRWESGEYKSRLVAQDFSQVPGIEYAETFAPVGRVTCLRLLLTIAATNGLGVRHADVEGGHLNGKLDVELYMAYPEDIMPKPECKALRLLGSMYGLKQSGRAWWIEPGQVLEALGFRRT
jgi:hypothetical protein